MLYLNPEWTSGDGGEIVLMPFMDKQIIIPPLFNRGVLFLSEEMNHRVLPARKTRYCFSVWIDRGEDTLDIDELLSLQRDAQNDQNEENCQSDEVRLGSVMVDKDMGWLRKPSVGCTLARWVYEESYVKSLRQCVDQERDIYKQLYTMHIRHVSRLKVANKASGLTEIVEWLQRNKPSDNAAILWDSM